MSRIILFVIGIYMGPILCSQNIKKCSTTINKKHLAWFKSYKSDPQAFNADLRTPKDIPLKIHIVGDDDGSGYYSIESLLATMCTLNEDYAPLNMRFYIYGDIDYINKSVYYSHSDPFVGNAMFLEYNDTTFDNGDTLVPINIYFVQEPRGTCGYYAPLGDAIAIKKACQQDVEHTLTHEIGHYFTLMHTFFGWEDGTTPALDKQEKMDQSNCNSPYVDDPLIAGAGDGFCDTPPDYLSQRWGQGFQNCNSGTLTDPNGVSFTVDGSFYMSYSDDVCQDKFSSEQTNAVLAYLNSERAYFASMGQISNTSEVVIGDIIEPLDGAVNVPYNWSAFQWDAVPGASAYNVIVSKSSTFLNPSIDIYTTNKYYIGTNLTSGESYYWKVKAIADGNACGGYNCTGSDCPKFTVGGYSSIQSLNKNAIQIYPNVLARMKNQKIKLKGLNEGLVQIYDVASQKVGSCFIIDSELELQPLENGIYFLNIESEGKIYNSKIVIQ